MTFQRAEHKRVADAFADALPVGYTVNVYLSLDCRRLTVTVLDPDGSGLTVAACQFDFQEIKLPKRRGGAPRIPPLQPSQQELDRMIADFKRICAEYPAHKADAEARAARLREERAAARAADAARETIMQAAAERRADAEDA